MYSHSTLSRHRNVILINVAIACVVAISYALLFRNELFAIAIASVFMLPALFFWALATFIFILELALAKQRKPSFSPTIYAVCTAIIISAFPMSILPGIYVAKYDVNNAKKYCESLIPQIEAYHAEHGHYPHDCSELELPEEKPRLIDDECYKSDHSGGYILYFRDHTEFCSSYEWHNSSIIWILNHS